MRDSVVEGAATCPTCPEGRCPQINTTPTTPEPPPLLVRLAAQAIPAVLAEECRVEDRFEAIASDLVKLLKACRDSEHLQAASEWAVHRLVQQRLLTAHAAFRNVRDPDFGKPRKFVEVGGEWFRERRPPITLPYLYGDGSAGNGTFVVRATDELWSTWRSDELNDKTYSPKDLRKELDISPPTLNQYMTQADVRPPHRGGHNRRYSYEERNKILKVVADQASPALAKVAREILSNETKIKER